MNRLPGGRCELEPHRALGLVLQDHGAGRHLVAVADVPNLQAAQVAAAQLAVDPRLNRQARAATFHLQTNTKGPDVPSLNGAF
jgi:hypothetical protein